MADTLEFDADTKLDLSGSAEMKDIHLKDLSLVLDIEHDGERVEKCTIDIDKLISALTIYSSENKFRYGWRRRWRDQQ